MLANRSNFEPQKIPSHTSCVESFVSIQEETVNNGAALQQESSTTIYKVPINNNLKLVIVTYIHNIYLYSTMQMCLLLQPQNRRPL